MAEDSVVHDIIDSLESIYLSLLFDVLPVHKQKECLRSVYTKASQLPSEVAAMHRQAAAEREGILRMEESDGATFCEMAEMRDLIGRVALSETVRGKIRRESERVYDRPDDDDRSYHIDIKVFLDGKQIIHFSHTDHWRVVDGRDRSYEFEHSYSEGAPPVFDVPAETLLQWERGLERYLSWSTGYYYIYRRPEFIEWQPDLELKPPRSTRPRKPAAWQRDMVLDGPPAKRQRRS